MKINNQLSQQHIKFGSRQIPRNIYHLTSNNNYQSMLKDGFIHNEGRSQLYIEKGIYALELSNFFKFWGENKDWGYDDLQVMILRHVLNWVNTVDPLEKELVILKIPTSKLDPQKLFIRSLNRLFSFMDNNNSATQVSDELKDHLLGMTPAKEAPLYKMRKEAIEYIYSENIPINDVERIGNIVNILSLRHNNTFPPNFVKSILKALLSGTPEANNLMLLKEEY